MTTARLQLADHGENDARLVGDGSRMKRLTMLSANENFTAHNQMDRSKVYCSRKSVNHSTKVRVTRARKLGALQLPIEKRRKRSSLT